MLVELLSTDNNFSYNISLARVLGLEGAVYCSALMNVYLYAQMSNLIDNENYVVVNRDYIIGKTFIPVDRQVAIDKKWEKLGLISIDKIDPNKISLNMDLLLSFDLNKDLTEIKKISTKAQIKTSKGGKTESDKLAISKALQKYVSYDGNVTVESALKSWVESIMTNPKGGYLTKQAIDIFINRLKEYAKNDTSVALRIVQLATTFSYRECNWAINKYESELRTNIRTVSNVSSTSTSDTKVATSIDNINTKFKF